MTRPALPDSQRRVPISVTLTPRALAILRRLVACGEVATRSAAVEWAILSADETAPQHAARRKARK